MDEIKWAANQTVWANPDEADFRLGRLGAMSTPVIILLSVMGIGVVLFSAEGHQKRLLSLNDGEMTSN